MKKYSEEEVRKAFITMIKYPKEYPELWEKLKKKLVEKNSHVDARTTT